MPYTYILYSEEIQKHYIGACQSSLEERINAHNKGFYGKQHFTSQAKDWKIILSFELKAYAHCIRLERK